MTEGDTEEEALAMAAEAITCHIAGLVKAGEDVPVERAPIKAKRIAVPVEVPT